MSPVDEPAETEFKIKLTFPLEGTKGFTTDQAFQFASQLIGKPEYVEHFNGEVEHFSYGVRTGNGTRSEECTWALELVDLEDRTWGLTYRFVHETHGVTFAVPLRAVIKKVAQGSLFLTLARCPVPAPVLTFYPLDELDDEPTLAELGEWGLNERRSFRSHFKEVFLSRLRGRASTPRA